MTRVRFLHPRGDELMTAARHSRKFGIERAALEGSCFAPLRGLHQSRTIRVRILYLAIHCDCVPVREVVKGRKGYDEVSAGV